jgi:hypothetical protein
LVLCVAVYCFFHVSDPKNLATERTSARFHAGLVLLMMRNCRYSLAWIGALALAFAACSRASDPPPEYPPIDALPEAQPAPAEPAPPPAAASEPAKPEAPAPMAPPAAGAAAPPPPAPQ